MSSESTRLVLRARPNSPSGCLRTTYATGGAMTLAGAGLAGYTTYDCMANNRPLWILATAVLALFLALIVSIYSIYLAVHRRPVIEIPTVLDPRLEDIHRGILSIAKKCTVDRPDPHQDLIGQIATTIVKLDQKIE